MRPQQLTLPPDSRFSMAQRRITNQSKFRLSLSTTVVLVRKVPRIYHSSRITGNPETAGYRCGPAELLSPRLLFAGSDRGNLSRMPPFRSIVGAIPEALRARSLCCPTASGNLSASWRLYGGNSGIDSNRIRLRLVGSCGSFERAAKQRKGKR